MELNIENVEQLTLNISAGAKPGLAETLQGLGFLVKRNTVAGECDCEFCTAARAVTTAARTTVSPAAADKALTVPRLGAFWPEQGGINAGLMRGVDGQPDYYQIIASGDAGEVADIAWAGSSCDSGDTAATSKQDGLANTKLLAESALDFPAARWAAGLTLEGHSDWYLPSQRELALCWANAPEAFSKGYHWSSTQYSRYYAWSQTFGDGCQDFSNKSAQLRARAVRRFIP